MKSFDPETEELVYTRNFNDEIPSPNGKGAVIINNVERYQPLKTMVHIKNNETQNEVILEGNTQVFLRPDLVIDSIQSPSEVQPNTPFGMSAQIKEINNDVGATAKIEVLNGDVVLDSIDSFSLEAGNERGAALLPTLNEVGTYTIILLHTRYGNTNQIIIIKTTLATIRNEPIKKDGKILILAGQLPHQWTQLGLLM